MLAVDQLEELFTVCEQEGDRGAFLDQLASAACDTGAAGAGLGRVTRGLLRPLRPVHPVCGAAQLEPCAGRADAREELARAIELPAARAGLDVERALVEDLVGDVAGEPGGLPLLSTMLLELWRVRDGRVLRARALRGERRRAGGGRSARGGRYAQLDGPKAGCARTVVTARTRRRRRARPSTPAAGGARTNRWGRTGAGGADRRPAADRQRRRGRDLTRGSANPVAAIPRVARGGSGRSATARASDRDLAGVGCRRPGPGRPLPRRATQRGARLVRSASR